MTRHDVTDEDGPVRVDTERRPVPPTEPLAAYLALAGRFGREQVCLLESAGGPDRDSRYHFVGFGVRLTVSVTRGEVRVDGAPALRDTVLRRLARLEAVEPAGGGLRLHGPHALWPVLRAISATFDAEGSASEFRFGFLAYFGYDAGRYVEDLPWLIDRSGELPDVHLVLYQGRVVTDTAAGNMELVVHQSGSWPRIEPDEVADLLAGDVPAIPPAPDSSTLPVTAVEDDTDRATFTDKVERSLSYIAAGDIYQVQIGHELAIRSAADPLGVYLRLRQRNPSPYMYLSVLAGHTVIGASPELFARVENKTVTMRPIAGTIPRGAAGDEDAARTLRTDTKERAEHTMLVDLCRNDLGRICRPDALAVPDRFIVERYSHVLHLVSTVTGLVEEGTDAFEVIAALFPAGTMTGTPKIRSMEIIEELEHSRRGMYAGALGLIDIGGHVNMALCIRTLIHHDGVYRTRASAGVVSDSVAAKEWTETLAKMSAPYWAVTGTELLPARKREPAWENTGSGPEPANPPRRRRLTGDTNGRNP